jgi:hypothetical protein
VAPPSSLPSLRSLFAHDYCCCYRQKEPQCLETLQSNFVPTSSQHNRSCPKGRRESPSLMRLRAEEQPSIRMLWLLNRNTISENSASLAEAPSATPSILQGGGASGTTPCNQGGEVPLAFPCSTPPLLMVWRPWAVAQPSNSMRLLTHAKETYLGCFTDRPHLCEG